jgi:LAO/AO transport system kinase
MPITQSQADLNGERLALTRALTQIENGTPEGAQILEEIFPYTGKSHLIGVTGAPGTGKSTLVNQLAKGLRGRRGNEQAPSVAIVAVDPTSPFSGGALLGDRIRMGDLAGDPGIFIRSMASRGSLGGLASTTAALVQVFDAAGFEYVVIETVGAGQAEVEIARLAHTTIVVEAPGMGDDIQTIKAGILEIADILILNKADLPGADNALRTLRTMVSLAHPELAVDHHGETMAAEGPADSEQAEGWTPPILPMVATSGEGIPQLLDSLEAHWQFLNDSGELARRDSTRLKSELENLLGEALRYRWESAIPPEAYRQVLDQVTARQVSPRQAVAALIQGAGI